MKNFIYSKTRGVLLVYFVAVVTLSANSYQDSSSHINLFPNILGNAKIDSLNNYAFNLGTTNLKLRMKIGEECYQLSKANNYDFGLAQSLNNLGVCYFNNNSDSAAVTYFKKALYYVEKIKDYKLETIIAINTAEVYSHEHLFDLSLVYYKKAMKSAVKSADSVSVAKIFNLIGFTYWRKGSFTQAIKYYKQSLKINKLNGDNKKTFKLLNNIGTAYYQIKDYKLALEYYVEAQNIRKSFSSKGSSILINNIGLVYLELNDTTMANSLFKSGQVLANETNSILGKGYSYLNLGDLNFKTKKYKSALKFYAKSKSFYKQLNDINGVAKIQNRMGKVYLESKKVKLAKKMFLDAYRISKNNGLKLTKTESLINICKVQILNNNNYSAKINLERAYKKAVSNKFFSLELEVYKLQAEVNKNLKNYKTALQYYQKYDSLKNSLYNKHSLRIISEAKEKYQADRKEKANLHLRNINKIQNLKIENAAREKFYISIASIIFLFAVIYLVYLNTQLKKKHKELLLAKKETEKIISRLNKTNKLLEYSNSTKDKFFSIIAHDLKNPFNTLLGASEMLDLDKEEMNDEERNELIEIIATDTKKLYALLENLLSWSRSQTGNLTAKIVEIPLNSLVADTVNLYKSSFTKKKIQVIINIPKELVVKFDEFMLHTIIRNLLSNAIKFSHYNGKITFTANKKEGKIILKIIDEGVGIAEEHQGKIFDENSDYKALGTDQEKGTGLGLLLSRDFIRENNAEISVESKINEGTTFKLTLEEA